MKMRIHPGWIPLYVLALLLGLLSLNTMAGVLVAPIAAVAVIAAALSFVPRLRFLRLIGHAAAVLIVGLYVFVLFIHPANAPTQARRESKRLLSEARDTLQRQKAVGSLGILIPYTNGQWIAIRYRDSHAWPGWSSAVALDSDKRFYESRRHFCGLLSAYVRAAELQREISKEMAEMGDTNTVNYLSGFEDIHAVASANGLQSAVPLLLKMGFRRLDQ